jgi:hypothetical protein
MTTTNQRLTELATQQHQAATLNLWRRDALKLTTIYLNRLHATYSKDQNPQEWDLLVRIHNLLDALV